MSTPRTIAAVARFATAVARFTAWPPAPRRCSQCRRTFVSAKPYRQSSKRQIQTATAYQPSSSSSFRLDIPPHDADVPKSSIAGGRPETSSTASRLTLEPTTHEERPSVGKEIVRILEEDTQQTQTETGKPPRLRRYKFGPRKATIKLTPSAVTHLRDLLDQPEPKYIRIGTTAKGCSGLAYKLEYVDKPSTLDEKVEQDGVTVLIDNRALLNIIGSEMDWLEDKLNQRFIFKNPNITEQCGCGESFSVS